mmetsp:Transcript_55486/g.161174  ORF Transcript_55486/g.161174 Transcript_55486/m.161174 type:complete len:271 (+) Transcript_55486:854-1666(+)
MDVKLFHLRGAHRRGPAALRLRGRRRRHVVRKRRHVVRRRRLLGSRSLHRRDRRIRRRHSRHGRATPFQRRPADCGLAGDRAKFQRHAAHIGPFAVGGDVNGKASGHGLPLPLQLEVGPRQSAGYREVVGLSTVDGEAERLAHLAGGLEAQSVPKTAFQGYLLDKQGVVHIRAVVRAHVQDRPRAVEVHTPTARVPRVPTPSAPDATRAAAPVGSRTFFGAAIPTSEGGICEQLVSGTIAGHALEDHIFLCSANAGKDGNNTGEATADQQ